jgi:hypothetical protein
VFTARYALSPYIKQIRFVFKELKKAIRRSKIYLMCSVLIAYSLATRHQSSQNTHSYHVQDTTSPSLKMETKCSPETLIINYQTIRRHVNEDGSPHLHRRENIQSTTAILHMKTTFCLILKMAATRYKTVTLVVTNCTT